MHVIDMLVGILDDGARCRSHLSCRFSRISKLVLLRSWSDARVMQNGKFSQNASKSNRPDLVDFWKQWRGKYRSPQTENCPYKEGGI